MDETLVGLNKALFEQLARLKDSRLKGSDLKDEVSRTVAMVSVSTAIVKNGELMLKAIKEDDRSGVSSIMDNSVASLLCIEN